MLIGEAPLGTRVCFGEYREREIPWIKVTEACDLFTARSVERLSFDSLEERSDSRERRRHGNNFFPHSNVFQWLNASGSAWWKPAHETDEMPYYYNIDGFLTGFTDHECSQIDTRMITVAVPLGNRKQYGRAFVVPCRVCLPSASELGVVIENSGLSVEGDSFLNGPYFDTTMTRSGVSDAGHIIIGTGGAYRIELPCRSFPVRPMIRLNRNTLFSDTPDNDGFHHIIHQHDEAFMRRFIDILKS